MVIITNSSEHYPSSHFNNNIKTVGPTSPGAFDRPFHGENGSKNVPGPRDPDAPTAATAQSSATTASARGHASLRSRRPGQWCWLDTAVIATYGPRIGAYGVAVYTVLAQHVNGKTQACWPSIGTIASALKLSRSTVKKTLRLLEAERLILTQPRRDAEGDPTSNHYTLLDPTPQIPVTVAVVDEGGRSSENPPPATTHPTGRASDVHKPSEPRPTERTSTPSDVRAALRERHPQPVTADETSSWDKPAVAPPWEGEARLGEAVDKAVLTGEQEAVVEQEVQAILEAQPLKQFIKTSLLHRIGVKETLLLALQHGCSFGEAREVAAWYGVERVPGDSQVA